MNNLQLHIQLEQKLNKAGLQVYNSLLDEQKDFWLNVGQMAFIRERVKPQPYWPYTFEDVRFQYDAIDALVSTNVPITLYIGGSNIVKGVLPADLMSPLSETVDLQWNCNGIAQVVVAGTKQIAVLPFPDDPAVGPYYNKFRIAILFDDASEDYILTEAVYTGYATGISYKEYSFYILQYFRERFKQLNLFDDVELYWERYDNIYRENSFIVVYDGVKTPLSLLWYTDETLQGTVPFEEKSYDRYQDVPLATQLNSDCRLIRHSELGDVLKHEFHTTDASSPIITKQGNTLNVYHDNTFTPTTAYVTYLRYPRTIDSAVNQTSELDEAFHDKIVDAAVEKLTAAFATNTHQLVKQDNLFNR